MLKRFIDYLTTAAKGKSARVGLYFYAVIEALVFLIPTDFLVISMTLVTPKKGQLLALIATIGSVTGASIIYMIGYYAFEPVAIPLLNFLCSHFGVACPDIFIPKIKAAFADYGFWLVATSIFFSIIPRRLIALVAGLTQMAIVPFVLASFLGRWLRYALVAALVQRYGEHATKMVRKNLAMSTIVIGIIVLIALVIYLFF